jgi:hypothetical protein
VELTYGQVETTLAAHLQIQPDRMGTFRSRIKQLQRLQFPPGVNVGRGSKMGYSGEHLFMLVTAFELIGIGLPAQTACHLVTRHWPHFAGGYALAALQARHTTKDKEDQVLALLWIKSMHEIQFGRPGVSEPSRIEIRDETAARSELRPYKFNRSFSRIVLSLGALLKDVLTCAYERAGALPSGEFDHEFHGWLPKGDDVGFHFETRYPDRSNLKMRVKMHRLHGKDPDSLTPDGAEEAREFLERDFSEGVPF